MVLLIKINLFKIRNENFLKGNNKILLLANNLILFTFIVISSLTLPHVFIMKDFVENK